jgi:membrane protein YdbS with pleckstrin-like domain
MSVMGIDETRKRKKYMCTGKACVSDWRVTFVLSYVTLILAIVFVYAAFVCASWMNFNMHLGRVVGLTGVTAVMLLLAVFWLLLGPFSITRWNNRRYDSEIDALIDEKVGAK